MAINDAFFSVSGYVATQPKKGVTRAGTKTLTFRIGWTPREVSRQTGEWADLPSSFASVTCYRKIAENAAYCLRKGDPIVLKGTLRVREYDDQAGTRRNSVDVVADFLGHDLAKGTSNFTKHSQRSQQTAEEYELSQATDGNRLPGDVESAQWQAEQQPEPIEPDELVAVDAAEAAPADGDDPERAAAFAGSDGDPGEPDDGVPGDPGDDDSGDGDDSDDHGGDSGHDAPDGSDQTEPSDVAEPQPTARGGRYRKAQPVGAVA
jgi:single-strand DNA-binding protein